MYSHESQKKVKVPIVIILLIFGIIPCALRFLKNMLNM